MACILNVKGPASPKSGIEVNVAVYIGALSELMVGEFSASRVTTGLTIPLASVTVNVIKILSPTLARSPADTPRPALELVFVGEIMVTFAKVGSVLS